MAKAQNGNTVEVHYKGTLDNGDLFDSSEGRDPLRFTLGAGQVVPGFEEAVIGMEEGSTKTVKIPADKAYGQHYKEMVLEFDRAQVPPGIEPEVGMQLELRGQDGSLIPVIVSEIKESTITLDGNHPLAGQDLTFEIQLVSVA